MLVKLLLLLMALLLLTGLVGCTGSQENPETAYDPCEQMKEDGRHVDSLQEDVKDLQARVYHEDTITTPDTGGAFPAESLLVLKEKQLEMAIQTMEDNSMACQVRLRGFDQYRTPEEREDRSF